MALLRRAPASICERRGPFVQILPKTGDDGPAAVRLAPPAWRMTAVEQQAERNPYRQRFSGFAVEPVRAPQTKPEAMAPVGQTD